MPIKDFPFLNPWSGANPNPWLPIKIINPSNGFFMYSYGLVDTGFEECVIPGFIASALGYKIRTGNAEYVETAGGVSESYRHEIKIEIYNTDNESCLHTIDAGPMDVMAGLNHVLLGVERFLEHFHLQVHYPKKIFSITNPR
jgi:predicted aspartyl protease